MFAHTNTRKTHDFLHECQIVWVCHLVLQIIWDTKPPRILTPGQDHTQPSSVCLMFCPVLIGCSNPHALYLHVPAADVCTVSQWTHKLPVTYRQHLPYSTTTLFVLQFNTVNHNIYLNIYKYPLPTPQWIHYFRTTKTKQKYSLFTVRNT
jgi:hypothetical protein